MAAMHAWAHSLGVRFSLAGGDSMKNFCLPRVALIGPKNPSHKQLGSDEFVVVCGAAVLVVVVVDVVVIIMVVVVVVVEVVVVVVEVVVVDTGSTNVILMLPVISPFSISIFTALPLEAREAILPTTPLNLPPVTSTIIPTSISGADAGASVVVVVVAVVVVAVVVVFAKLHFGAAVLSQMHASFALHADNLSAEQSLSSEASDLSSDSAPASEARLHSFLSVSKEHAALALHFFFLSPVHSSLELESVSEARLHSFTLAS